MRRSRHGSETLGERLQELRGDRAAFYVEQETGISRANLLRYERDEVCPNRETLRKLSDFYEVPYADLRLLSLIGFLSRDREDRELVLEWAREELSNESQGW